MDHQLPAFVIGQLAERLCGDYYGYDALIQLGRDPRAATLVPAIEPGNVVPIGRISGPNEREAISYHYIHFLEQAVAPGKEDEHARVWLSGALITLGDALARNRYFDRAPELEMVRHLRNAVAHGNRFNIRNPTALEQFPAHTHLSNPHTTPTRDITRELHGTTCMFEYMKPYEILSLFTGVGRYLLRVADGLPGHGNSVEGSISRARAGLD